MILKKAVKLKGRWFRLVFFDPSSVFVCNQIGCKYSSFDIDGHRLANSKSEVCSVCCEIGKRLLPQNKEKSYLDPQFTYVPEEIN